MAVTHTLLTEGSSETDGTSFVTASITPSANKLLVLDCAAEATVGSGNVIPTLSGCGVTWVVEISTAGVGGEFSRLTTFRALGTPTTGVLTISFSETQTAVAWSVCEKGNVDTGGTNGSAAIPQSASNTGTGTGLTVTLAAFGNVNNATHGSYQATIEASGLTIAPGTGFTEQTEINIDLSGGWFSTLQTQYRVDNDTTVNATASSAPPSFAGHALEIKESSGATEISAGFDTLVITEYTAGVNAETNVAAGVDALAITTYNASISLGVDIGAGVVSLNITEYPASINAETNVNAGVGALTTTPYAATISLVAAGTEINAGVTALALTTHPASIAAATTVAANTASLILTVHAAVITAGVPITTYQLLVGNQMIAQLTDTDFPLDLAVDNSGGVTGLAVTVALRDPNDNTSFLDFADSTFKTSGWTTRYQSLAEYGNGFYGTNLDVSAITNFPSAKHAAVEYNVTGSVIAVSQSLLSISQTWQQAAALTVGKFLGLI